MMMGSVKAWQITHTAIPVPCWLLPSAAYTLPVLTHSSLPVHLPWAVRIIPAPRPVHYRHGKWGLKEHNVDNQRWRTRTRLMLGELGGWGDVGCVPFWPLATGFSLFNYACHYLAQKPQPP